MIPGAGAGSGRIHYKPGALSPFGKPGALSFKDSNSELNQALGLTDPVQASGGGASGGASAGAGGVPAKARAQRKRAASADTGGAGGEGDADGKPAKKKAKAKRAQ